MQVLEYIPLKIWDMKTSEIMFWKKTLTSTQGCRRKKKSCNSVAWSRLFVKGKKQEVIQEGTFHALNSFLYLSFTGLWIAANTSAAAVSDSHTGLASSPVINSKDLSLRLRQDRRRWIRLPSSFTESFIYTCVVREQADNWWPLPPLGGLPVTAAEYW